MIMLNKASTASLDAYEARIREYATKSYTDCWFLVYQADTRARSEYWDKVLRQVQIEHAKHKVDDFDPDQPWDYVIRHSVNDEHLKNMAW